MAATGSSTATMAGAQLSAMNAPAPIPPSFCSASRLVRFETGRSIDAQLASMTVVSANGSGFSRTCFAIVTTMGVRSTAVVSSDRNTVLTVATPTVSSHSIQALPRAARVLQAATTSNRPASAASSATTVIARTKSSTGHTRSSRARASAAG
jgi:hypothetical protein